MCHNFAGLSALSDLITHERLVVYLHTNSADVWPRLSQLAPFIDGCITAGNDLAREVKTLLGDSSITVAPLEYPLDDSFFRARRVKKNNVILIGYAGDWWSNKNGLNGLKNFAMPWRLRRGFPPENRRRRTGKSHAGKAARAFPVDFLGLLKREHLAGTFAAWDFQIVTSDYETGPLSALEGMACGVIPIFPDIECQVSDVLGGKFDRLLYPVGNMPEAAARLRTVVGLTPAAIETLRSDLRLLVAHRSMASHLQAVCKILEEIHAKPSLRKKIRFQTCWKDHLPLAFRCRLSGNSEFLK